MTFKPRGLFGQTDLHVVIVGVGFAGLAAAHEFASTDFQVTLIDANNFHTFQPLLYQLATAGLDPADIAFPEPGVCPPIKRGDTHRKSLRASSRWTRFVELSDGAVIPYDALIVATGATTAFYSIPGASEHAMPLYTLRENVWLSEMRSFPRLEAHDALPIREKSEGFASSSSAAARREWRSPA